MLEADLLAMGFKMNLRDGDSRWRRASDLLELDMLLMNGFLYMYVLGVNDNHDVKEVSCENLHCDRCYVLHKWCPNCERSFQNLHCWTYKPQNNINSRRERD